MAVAVFLLIGRWTPARLDGPGWSPVPLLAQARVWLAVGIACLAGFWCASLPIRRPGSPRPVALWTLLFFGWVLASAAWSPDPYLGWAKALDVAPLVVVLASLHLALRHASAQAAVIACWSATIALLLALAGLGLVSFTASTRLAVLGGGPIVYGRNMALLALGALFLHYGRGRSALWLAVIAGSVPLVILTGSRGAMLSGLVAGCVTVGLYARGSIRKLRPLLVAASLPALLLQTDLGRTATRIFQHRVFDLTLHHTYTAGRRELFRAAWHLGLEHPVVGAGLAGFSAEVGRNYPHNLFLEVFCETGAVGLLLLGLALLAGLVALGRERSHLEAGTVGAALLFFVASQFSGSLYDTRGLWVWLVLAIAAARERALGTPGPPQRRGAMLGGLDPTR